ncbi:hypothetical protein [Nostoc sp. TCL240-02]|uniref:hypothetical protein n=1 Tax=Nostoc sp. TCL240-02 TaxID=2572090 RepID=UPI00157F7FC4
MAGLIVRLVNNLPRLGVVVVVIASIPGSVHPLCSLLIPPKTFIKQVRDNPCCSAKAFKLLPSIFSPVGDRSVNFRCLRSGGTIGCPSGVQCRHPLCMPIMHLEIRDSAIGHKPC